MTGLSVNTGTSPVIQPSELNTCPNTLTTKVNTIAKDALIIIKDCAVTAGLFVFKVAAITAESVAIAFAVSIAALSILFSVPASLFVNKERAIMPFLSMVSLIDALVEVVKITYALGKYPVSQRLQKVDSDENTPHFVKITPAESLDRAPILYAPGYLDSPDSLRSTCQSLADRTHSTVYIIKYYSLTQSVDANARDVERLHKRIVQESNTCDIIFVGHSMGGLTTGRYIQQAPENQLNVRLWVTIGSPLKGTALATHGFGDCSRDMKPDSEFIQELNRPGILDTVKSLHIFSRGDSVVPPESAVGRKDNATTTDKHTYECKLPYSHLGMRARAEVEDKITAEIDAVYASIV